MKGNGMLAPQLTELNSKKMGNKGSKNNVENNGEGDQSLSLTNLSITNILLLSSRGSSQEVGGSAAQQVTAWVLESIKQGLHHDLPLPGHVLLRSCVAILRCSSMCFFSKVDVRINRTIVCQDLILALSRQHRAIFFTYSSCYYLFRIGRVFRALPVSTKGLELFCSKANTKKPSMWSSLSIKRGQGYNLHLPLSLKVFCFSLAK